MNTRFTPTQILKDVWYLPILAYAVSVTLTPVARWLAYRLKIVDRPDNALKTHARPVAYMGGLAVCAGFVVALVAGVALTGGQESRFPPPNEPLPPGLGPSPSRPVQGGASPWSIAIPVLIATVIITLTGLIDDLKQLTPRRKVLGQLLAAAVLFMGLTSRDIHESAAKMLLSPLGLTVPLWLACIITGLMTAAIVVAACNATNLLDGLDGLCGGVTGIIAVGFVVLTVYLACYGFYTDEGTDNFRVLLCLCMAGAVLGFLPYNIPPASIFLGDAGSMLLGFFVATMMMLFAREGTLRWFLAACVIFGLPIIDTGLAVVRRALARKSIFAGDRGHLYDQLVDRGMRIRSVVALFYALAVLAALIGTGQAMFIKLRYAVMLDVAVLALIVVVFVRKRMILPAPKDHPPGGQA